MRCLSICAAGLSLSTARRRACRVARSIACRSLTGKTPQSVFSAVCTVGSLFMPMHSARELSRAFCILCICSSVLSKMVLVVICTSTMARHIVSVICNW